MKKHQQYEVTFLNGVTLQTSTEIMDLNIESAGAFDGYMNGWFKITQPLETTEGGKA